MIEGILRLAEWYVVAREIVADAFGLIHDVDTVIFPFDIFLRCKIRILGRFTEIHQTGNFLNRGMEGFQIGFTEILILNLGKNRIPAQHAIPLEQLLDNLSNLLFRSLAPRTRRHQKTQLFRLACHTPEIAPFLLGEQ